AISKSPQKEQPDEGITLSGASPQFKDLFQRCKTVTPNRVMESEPVIKRMDELVSGIQELVRLCEATNRWENVDTVLFTGRSTRFPPVKDRIRAVLDPEAHVIDLAVEEKTCVARGAAFWGMERNTIHLQRAPVSFAHYGIGRFASQQQTSLQFVPLVQAGAEYRNHLCTGSDGPRDYLHNNFRVDLFQLMGADATAALCDPDKSSRRTLLASFRLAEPDSLVRRIVLNLREDDTFDAALQQQFHDDNADGKLNIKDVGEDSDETASWLVDTE